LLPAIPSRSFTYYIPSIFLKSIYITPDYFTNGTDKKYLKQIYKKQKLLFNLKKKEYQNNEITVEAYTKEEIKLMQHKKRVLALENDVLELVESIEAITGRPLQYDYAFQLMYNDTLQQNQINAHWHDKNYYPGYYIRFRDGAAHAVIICHILKP